MAYRTSTKTNLRKVPGAYDPAYRAVILRAATGSEGTLDEVALGWSATDEEPLSKQVVIKIMLNVAPDAWERKNFAAKSRLWPAVHSW